MALILLCHRWARARGGRALAISIDHRLRPESAAEARQVARWIKARGIPHAALAWQHEGKRSAALQARARTARYELLSAWCRKRAILALALAHHAGDQTETVLMRLARGGGIDGLAGMSAVASREGVRLIRPLLGIDPARLRATLAAAKQDWIEDPSNTNAAFERVRWRRVIPAALVPELAAASAEIGAERSRREADLADLLAETRIDPAGFLSLPLAALMAVPPALAERALARCLMVIGGEDYPPVQESLARLRDNLAQSPTGRTLGARTLGGCRLICQAGELYVFRELGPADQRLAVHRGQALRWDNRFDLVANAAGEIARLGESGWAMLRSAERPASIPRTAALALPALWTTGRGPSRLGHLFLPGNSRGGARFRPGQPLVPSGFTVVKLNVNII